MNSKPFIHLYRSPRGYYFYDVNRDSIISVSGEIYDYLDGKKVFEELSCDGKNCINSLKEDGYLSDKHYLEIKHPSTDNLEEEITRRSKQLILQVTQACNLICSYCAYANTTDGSLQRNHSSKMMTWETAKEAIDLFYEHSIDSDSVSISFYGGEPIIALDLIKKCVDYCENLFLGKDFSFNLTTNATLLNDEIIDYLYEHNFNLMFSIDGPEEIHDINRRRTDGKGSFKSAFENLHKAIEKYGDDASQKITTNTVINPTNDADLTFSLFDDDIYRKGNIIGEAGIADDVMLQEKIDMTDLYREKIKYQYFLAWLDYLKIVKGLKIYPFIKKGFLVFSRDYAAFKKGSNGLADTGAPSGPCIPGQRRRFVNADGDIYPCERVSEVSDVMNIGTLKNGFDFCKASDLLNVGQITAEKCKNCYASSRCNICGKSCINDDGYDVKTKIKACGESIRNFDQTVKSMILIKEIRTLYKRRPR